MIRSQMTYAQVATAHRQETTRHVAHHYGVDVERVKYIGEAEQKPLLWTCENHRETFGMSEHPAVFISRPPTVELSKHFRHVDKVLNRFTDIMVGQCPECGEVYIADLR